MSIKKDHDASRSPGEEQEPRGKDVTKWKKGRDKRRGRRKPRSWLKDLFT